MYAVTHINRYGIWYAGTIVVIAILIAVGIISSGTSGSLAIVLPPMQNIFIFIDEEERAPSRVENGIAYYDTLTEGGHSAILSAEGFWPWSKDVVIPGGVTKTLAPFLVPRNPSGFIVNENDSEYDTIRASFGDALLPSPEHAAVSADNNTKLWIEEGAVVAEWVGSATATPWYFCRPDGSCDAPGIVFSPVAAIRSLSFYKDRNDVFILAAEDGIFAVEFDPTPVQNFQPVYKGASPDFRVKNASTLYVKDGELYYIVSY